MKLFRRSLLCCLCGERLKQGSERFSYGTTCLCGGCFESLEKTSDNSLFEGRHELDFVSAPFYYTDAYRNIFLSFKFGGNMAQGHIIGMAAREYFSRMEVLREYDCMIPVPLTAAGERKRGFNQALVLARYFSEGTGVPILNGLFRRVEKVPQSSLSGPERRKNIAGAFSVSGDVSGKSVLVADDLFTTGSTMRECAKVLREAGAVRVGGVTAGYVMHPHREYNG